MTNIKSPKVEVQMLIRKPVDQVFNAFIDPEITKHFWFTKSSGQLETGKTIKWEWEIYDVSADVIVDEIVLNERISIRWGDPQTNVDFNFKPLDSERTYVVISNYGFKESGNELLELFKDLTGGFTTVVDGLKAYLEFNIDLNLIGDKFPKEIVIH